MQSIGEAMSNGLSPGYHTSLQAFYNKSFAKEKEAFIAEKLQNDSSKVESGLSAEEIIAREVATGVPIVYRLGEDGEVLDKQVLE